MNTLPDTELDALDQFVSSIYWADDELTLSDALTDAVDEWTATAAAEHNGSKPFTTVGDTDALATALHELLAAVDFLNTSGARTGLTTTRALCEALADRASARRPQERPRGSRFN